MLRPAISVPYRRISPSPSPTPDRRAAVSAYSASRAACRRISLLRRPERRTGVSAYFRASAPRAFPASPPAAYRRLSLLRRPKRRTGVFPCFGALNGVPAYRRISVPLAPSGVQEYRRISLLPRPSANAQVKGTRESITRCEATAPKVQGPLKACGWQAASTRWSRQGHHSWQGHLHRHCSCRRGACQAGSMRAHEQLQRTGWPTSGKR